ncbi:MAG TPA: competence/damage-inducible protein A [Candidatus Eisenbergiella merdipullorum]|uniref:Putative competence-damage inducible protein n=1 Tax=Candidatus Eisenbergiella merdipullorum TaxID=2838553 RepID=A0A9D2I4F7_9FIRM|nr:competence/damage-inducible protein A [Candidatus Eisenbergiella merdipullorum]
MVVELISVGTELLLGNIVNTNAAWLAEQCAALGLSCYYQTVVGDNEERLSGILETGLGRSDVLILSGGLGPTQDDLTKETAARVCGKRLVEDAHSLARIESYFKQRGLHMTDNNRKQALVPEGAIVVDNDNGTAPGIILEKDGKRIILLPGPPNELLPMFEKSIAPYLLSLNPDGAAVIYSRTVKICGLGESGVESLITDLEALKNPTVAPYAKTGEVHLRVTARAADEKSAKKLVKPVVKELEDRFGRAVYTTKNGVTLEEAVAKLLEKNGLTAATVESCTGGLLAGRLVNVSGVSKVFKTGFVTYSNKAKRKLVGVRKETLEKYGAVSPQTAQEMAVGGAKAAGADVAVSVTGIAGPDGGSEEKPVGLVYMACFVRGNVWVEKFRFNGNRAKVRESSVAAALTLMRRCILEVFK